MREGVTYNVFVKQVFWVRLAALVSSVAEDEFYLVFLFGGGIYVVSVGQSTVFTHVVLERFKVLDVVDIIWDFTATTGHANRVVGVSAFLLLFRTRAVV